MKKNALLILLSILLTTFGCNENQDDYSADVIVYGGTSAAITAAVHAIESKQAVQDVNYEALKARLWRHLPKRSAASVKPENAGDKQDPFEPYLNGQAPRVIKELGNETINNVKIRKLIFHSRNVRTPDGEIPTEIFAMVARPVQPGNYPGLLVLHGGGGAAESEKAVRWARRGYIVVTLDLPGIANTEKVPYSSGVWKSFPYGRQRFFTASPDITHSTIFDGVLAAVQGLFLLSHQENIIHDRIGVTGGSWGGYMTTMVSGLAHKLIAASFSTYGCGFYDTASTFSKNLDAMPAGDREVWLAYLDAGRRAHTISSPFFIAAATNDNFFYPPAVMATLKKCNGPVNHLFAPNANHSAPIPGGTSESEKAGWLKMEETYFDFYLKDKGFALPRVILSANDRSKNPDDNTTIRFLVNSETAIVSAEVYYSIQDTLWTKREWVGIKAKPLKNGWFEAKFPGEVKNKKGYWFVTVSDARPVTASSYMIERQW